MDVDKLVPEVGDLAGFIEQFSVFASAPNGVNQLRNLIIQLGIKGQLVKQVSEDGSACSELESILVFKTDLIKQKLFKRTPKLEKIEIYVEPYKLPSSWVWTTLAAIGQINPRNNVDDEIECSFIPMPSISQVYNGVLLKEARQWKDIKSGFTHLAEGDIALAKITPCFQNSKVAIMRGLHNDFGAGTTELHVFRPIDNTILPEYVYLYLKSPKFIQDGILKMTGSAGQKRVPVGYFAGTPFPLPPLEEQKRIIAKVDELMALCDKLEAQQQQQANNVLRANTSAINALLNPEPQQALKSQKTSATVSVSEPKASFEQNWQRIAQHFNTLYGCTLPMPKGEGRKKKYLVGLENVKALRQAVINLAVAGRLSNTSPNDLPSSIHLNSVFQQIDKMVSQGKVKKSKPVCSLSEEHVPYELPSTWKWVSLGELCPEFQNGVSSRGDKDGVATVVLRLADIKNQKISFENTRTIPISPSSVVRYSLQKDDILIIRVNGSADIVGQFIHCDKSFEAIYCDHFIRLRFLIPILIPNYLSLLARSDLIRTRIKELFISTAGQKTVNQKHISSLLISFPPLEEQKRILTKVDQIMTLCDQLEQQLTHSYIDAEKLMQATVKALVA